MRRVAPSFLLLFALSLLCLGYAADVRLINNRDYFPEVYRLINDAKVSVYTAMFSARYYEKYPLSKSNMLLSALADAARRGVEVVVVLEKSSYDRKLNRENALVYNILKNFGVRVYFDSIGTTTHAKLVIVDHRYVVVGSANWTYYALDKNNEANVLIDSPEVAEAYETYFLKSILLKCSGVSLFNVPKGLRDNL